MALDSVGQSKDNGIAFIVAAGIVAELVAKACSSPQTTELNAGARAATLMKWVNIGMIESAIFIAGACLFDKAHRWPILLGGGLEAAITYGEYVYAKQSGLSNPGPPTEQYPPAGG